MTDGGRPSDGPGPQHVDAARRLIAAHPGASEGGAGLARAVDIVGQHLSAELTQLIGWRAFDALLARAVHLSRRDFRLLSAVETEEGGTGIVTRLSHSLADADPGQAVDAAVSVLAHFGWLLATFIGEDLAGRLLQKAYPNRVAAEQSQPPIRNLDKEGL